MAAISLMKLSSNCARLLRVQISFNNLSIAKYAKPAAGMQNFRHRVSSEINSNDYSQALVLLEAKNRNQNWVQ